MEKLTFNISINASPEKVWRILWDDETYRKWTAVFAEGSYAESNWQEGDEIKFLSPEGSGMYSIIESSKPFREMIFRHLGEIQQGVKHEKDWAGAREKYFLAAKGEGTELNVELDMTEEHKAYFDETFPKALQVLKQISEENME